MHWDLGVPLLVVLATGILMAGIFYAAKGLIVKARQDDGIDPPTGSGGGHHHCQHRCRDRHPGISAEALQAREGRVPELMAKLCQHEKARESEPAR